MTIDTLWLLFGTILVLIMQAGFLCFESGLTRAKNSINVAMKNTADLIVTFMVWWSLGFGFAFGDSWQGLVGSELFFVSIDQHNPALGSFFIFQAMFCATAITIISGAIAERTKFGAYMLIALVVAAFIYPFFTHLAWGGALGGEKGYLAQIGFVDFAGSTVVHSLGGWAALAAIIIVGPRIGVFEKGHQHIPASNLTLATLAIIMFIIGWIGFNAGSTLAFNNLVPSIIVNTLMAAMSGGITCFVLSKYASHESVQSSVAPLNGIIAGLVAITAGCHAVNQVAAMLIGGVGAAIAYYGSVLLAKYKIDDAIDAIPAHLFAGVWGTLAVALFADLSLLGTGLTRLEQVQAQLTGIFICAIWTFSVSWILLKLLNRVYPLRVSAKDEHIGLNVSEHGARTDLIDFLFAVNDPDVDKDLSKRLPVEPFTEVGQLAQKYNQLIERAEEAVHKTKTIIKDVQAGILTLDQDAHLINANPAAQVIFGIDKQQRFPIALSSLIDCHKVLALPNEEDITQLPWCVIFETVEEIFVEGKLKINQQPIYLNMSASTSSHNEEHVICFVHDITRQRIAENELFQEKEKAKKTLDSIGDGVISTTPGGNIQYINHTGECLTGWLEKDALGKPLHRVFCAVEKITDHPSNQLIERINKTRETIITEKSQLLFSRSDNIYAIRYTAAPIFDKSNELSGIVIVFQDITQSQQIQRKLNYQATHDPLTDLYNRREFDIRLQQLVKETRANTSSKLEHSLIFIDLDQFKLVNDICGHAAGDTLLKEISKIMKTTVRQQDTLARLGGDEFAIILVDCPRDKCVLIAEKLRKRIAAYRYYHDGKEFSVTTSIGVVVINSNTESVQNVLIQADSACYTSKKRGKNQVSVYEKSNTELEQISGDAQWAVRLQQAINQDTGFELFFQLMTPVTEQANGHKSVHCEILLRMKEEELIISPNAFLPAAERYGLIHKIDAWVIKSTFKWLHKQQDLIRGQHIQCSINLSGKSIGNTEIINIIHQYQREYQITPANICFEITETAAIGSISKATAFIENLSEQGYHFSLDDFGAGLSSFNYLKNLPVNYLKIDGSFIRNIDTDPMDQAMVKSMIELGKTLGVETVAEYVTSEDIALCLARMGVDYLQGFHFHKPEPIHNLIHTIRADTV